MKKQTISVIGLGKLGLNMAMCIAYRGYRVIGVDNNKKLIKMLNNNNNPLSEPGLDEIMEKASDNFEATTDIEYAVHNADIIFIFVGTPSTEDGGFSSHFVEQAATEIALNLKDINKYKLIVNRSTVMPGVTDGVVKRIIEEYSGKIVGEDIGLCFNPEFMALGSAIHNFLHPDVIAIGESDSNSGQQLSDFYKNVCENDPAIVRTSLTNAEWSKISLNVFLTVKMSFANTIAEVCERIDGGDVDKISDILGHDPRIGRKFLSGAIGYGGPCFPRDTKAFTTFTKNNNCKSELSIAAEKVNDRQSKRVLGSIKNIVGELGGKTIAVLGLTYKPDTDIVDPSDQLNIVKFLLSENAIIKACDPMGIKNARKILGDSNIKYTKSAIECLKGTDLCLLATPWEEFKKLRPKDFTENMKAPIVFDCWRIQKNLSFDSEVDYYGVGIQY